MRVVSRSTGADGRNNKDWETCAPAVDRGAGGLGCRWRGLDAGSPVAGTMDDGGMDNGGMRHVCSKKATLEKKPCACKGISKGKKQKNIFFPNVFFLLTFI